VAFIVRVGDDDDEFFCEAQGAWEGFCREEDEPGDDVGDCWRRRGGEGGEGGGI
jgi:hypothetical protein